MSAQQTEARIAAALAARAGGITMDTSTIEDRFAELQARAPAARARRRRTLAAGAALATAAAVVAVVGLSGVLPDGSSDDRSLPAAPAPRVLVGSGNLVPGDAYTVEAFDVPFTLEVPEPPIQGGEGRWEYNIAGDVFELDLGENSAALELVAPDQTYAPDRAWNEQTVLVAAPDDVAGWVAWLEATGLVSVTGRTDVEVDGFPAARLEVTVGDAAGGCPVAGADPCVAVYPKTSPTDEPDTVGTGDQAGFAAGDAEITVIDVGDRAVLLLASGPAGSDTWRTGSRDVVGGLDLG